jgi:hypothetical protein
VEGEKIALELIEELREDFQGVYFMPPFSRFNMIASIIDKIKS